MNAGTDTGAGQMTAGRRARLRLVGALSWALALALAVTLGFAAAPAVADPGQGQQPPPVPNAGFEEPVVDGQIPGWTMFGAGGAGSRTVVEGHAYEGEHSFRMVDPEDDVAYGLMSDRVPVEGGETYEASYRAWVDEGVPSMYFYYYDENGEQLTQTSRHFRGLPNQEWVKVSIEAEAPEGAATAAILIYSMQASVSDFHADQVELRLLPKLDVVDHGVAMHTPNVRLAEAAVLSDGTAVGYLFNDGEPVSLTMVDLRTGEALDRHDFDGYSVASAIVVDPEDDMVYLSVRSPNDGTLWRYDPHNGELTELATRVVGEAMLRSMLIHEGTLYGSTYPAAKAYSYDLSTGDIRDYGSVAEGASYAWGFAEVDGDLWVGTGTTPYLREVEVDSGEITDLDLPADIVDNADFINRMVRHEDLVVLGYSPGGERSVAVYDLTADEWCCEEVDALGTWTEESYDGAFYYISGSEVRGFDIETRTTFSIGWAEAGMAEVLPGTRSLHLVDLGSAQDPQTTLVGIREDGAVWHYDLDSASGELVETDIEGAPATIHSMGLGPDGNPYMGAYLSSGVMARVDQETGALEALDGPGQADAITAVGDTLVVGAYPNAQFFAGDVGEEWDWGTNPQHVFTIGRDVGQDRVSDLISTGDLAAAATVPNYGELGGALVVFDPVGTTKDVYRDVVPNHSVTALAYRDGYIYGGTSIHGGIDSEPVDDSAQVFVWDVAAAELVGSTAVDADAEVVHTLAFDDAGRLWGMTDNGTFFEFDIESNEVSRSMATGVVNSNVWGRLSEMAVGPDGSMYGNAGGRLYQLEPETMEFDTFGPAGVRYSAMTSDGTLYFADETNVFSLSIGAAEPEPEVCDATITDGHRGPLTVAEGVTCIDGGALHGPVTVQSGAGLIISGAELHGPLTVADAETVELVGAQVRGPVSISGVTGRVVLDGNEIHGPVTLTGSSTNEAPAVVGNVISGPIHCSGNSPAPTGGTAPNQVRGPASGQCAGL